MEQETKYSLWTFFIIHLILYSVVNLFFLIVNLATYPKALWVYIPMLVWGVLLGFHYWINKLAVRGIFTQIQERLINKFSK